MQSEKKVVSLFGKSKQGHNMFTPSENENNKHCISEIWNFDPKSECPLLKSGCESEFQVLEISGNGKKILKITAPTSGNFPRWIHKLVQKA